jgi:hypothetical protein
MDKNIIVCNECHAVNFEERFSWICPICGVKFHLHSVIGTKPFAKKKYVINKSFNKSLGINESKYYLNQKLKNLELYNENKNIINKDYLSPRIGGNITVNNINTKKIYFKNNISPINNNQDTDKFKKNQIYDYNKKTKITNLKDYKSNNSNSPKKKTYRTLLDILKKRQNSVSVNKKKKKKNLTKQCYPKKIKL